MKKLFFFAFAAAALAPWAGASTVVDDRGYETCESRLNKEFDTAGPTFARQYYVSRQEDARTYFINAHIWADNRERTAVKATCVTSANGREVRELETQMGAHAINRGGVAAR